MTHQVGEYLEVGMDDVVAKPLQLQALLAALQRALGGANSAPDQPLASAGL